MIANIYRGDGFRGLLDYLSNKEGSRLLDTNLEGMSPRAFARQVGEVRQLHPKKDIARPVCHIPLRPAPGEDLTDEQWNEVLQFTLERMGFSNSPYVAYLHDHGDGQHLHIATYRVSFEGRLVSDSNDRFRVMAVAREIEHAYGLVVATAKHPIHLTRPALERLLRDPDRATALAGIRRAVDQAASKHDTVRAFMTELRRLGVVAELKVARNSGALQGIRFSLPDGSWIKGTDLGREYSLAKVCHRHELRFDRRPEGRFVAMSEVSDKEFRTLLNEGLAPDQLVRYGSRRTLFWELPPGHESGFVDLIAARLPHRFLHFQDELPKVRTNVPDLGERARQVQVLLNLVEAGPAAAPSLPLPPPVEAREERPCHPAVRCQELSAALLGATDLPPATAAALRAEYHEAMAAALSRPLLGEEMGGGHLGPGSSVPDFIPPQKVESAQVPRFRQAGAPPEVESTQLSPIQHRVDSRVEPAQVSLSQVESPPGQPEWMADGFRPRRAPDLDELGERTLSLASQYERDGSMETFRMWARLQQELRCTLQEAQRPSPAESSPSRAAALQFLAEDLRAAHRQFNTAPSEAHRIGISRRQTGYEDLARQIETHRSARVPASKTTNTDLVSLGAELLASQDRYLSDPTSESEAEWRRVRQQYQTAVQSQRPARPQPPPSVRLSTAIAQEMAVRKALAKRLPEQERIFLQTPQEATARDGWVSTLSALRESEGRLTTLRQQHLDELGRELRQSASTLAFYEEAFFRSPSVLTERLWRQAEQAHLRSSLTYDRARLRLTARGDRAPRAERPALAATAGLTRVYEKELLGQGRQARNLGHLAALTAWAQTPLGRAALAATQPLRALAQSSPAGAALVHAVGTTSEVVHRSLLVYAELRALDDRFRGTGLPRGKRDLIHGDLSSRSLASAVVRHRVVEPPHTPTSLPEAVRSSRSAEAALLRNSRNFRKGLVSEPELAASAARALAARAAVTAQIHLALGIPSVRDLTAVLGSQQGRALSAWTGALLQAGLSARSVATALVEAAPAAIASASAAVVIVGARRLIRWVAHHLRSRALEVLREQNEQRR